MGRIPPGVGPKYSQVVVLVGATGDLSRRKLLPGLFHLSSAGFIPGCRIIGVSLDDIDADGFREIAREALDQFSTSQGQRGRLGHLRRDSRLCAAGRGRRQTLKAAVEKAEQNLGGESSPCCTI